MEKELLMDQYGVSAKTEHKYGMHIASDFNIMLLHSTIAFNSHREIPPQMPLKLQRLSNNEIAYFFPLDMSQMHVPYSTYRHIPHFYRNHTDTEAFDNFSHTVTLHIFTYDIYRYLLFQGIVKSETFTNKEGAMYNPVMAEFMAEEVMDEMKEILFTNNIYLVTFTFLISFLKTFLEFFAIKN